MWRPYKNVEELVNIIFYYNKPLLFLKYYNKLFYLKNEIVQTSLNIWLFSQMYVFSYSTRTKLLQGEI